MKIPDEDVLIGSAAIAWSEFEEFPTRENAKQLISIIREMDELNIPREKQPQGEMSISDTVFHAFMKGDFKNIKYERYKDEGN